MSDQFQISEPAPDTPPEAPAPPPSASGAQGFDSILDELDDILETNAVTFVRGFIQEGGQ